MNIIKLNEIQKNNNTIEYWFESDGDIVKYFSEKKFVISYPEIIEKVPDSIACIPFVCNVLPIVWITDAVLVVPELDEIFYKSISEFKKGYQEMFPETDFLGRIIINKIVPNHYSNNGKAAMFYSGGLDSVQTLISHLNENPILLTVWGSDIRYDNVSGWKLVQKAINEVADKYRLKQCTIRSTFREFDNENLLDKDFSNLLKDNWWHGVKHGIGLLGHVAPYAWIHQINIMYIASSYCFEDGKVRCASSPIIDNYVKFMDCVVVHDGFEYNRQKKVNNIVRFCRATKDYVPFHVCWQSQSGSNCCYCEKCYRTMTELIVEGENPVNYGFSNATRSLKEMEAFIVNNKNKHIEILKKQWIYTQKRAKENQKNLRRSMFYKYIKWILKADFENPERLKLSFYWRFREYIYKSNIYKWLRK